MRFLTLAALTAAAALTALSARAAEIYTLDEDRQASTVEVKDNAGRVAVMDLAALDILDNLGLGDRVVAMSKASRVPYLSKYFDDDGIINVGTLKEVDYEKLMQARPDVIFISGRLAASLGKLSKIAPTVYLGIDYSQPFIDCVERNAEAIGTIYGKAGEVAAKLSALKERAAAIREKAAGKTAVVGMTTAGNFKTLGDGGRAGMIGSSLGFNNLAREINATHGNESSFELLLKLDPQYVFILDRDSAISTPGARLARDLMDNDLVKKTQAYRNGNIYYLNAAVWYLAEGGISATDLMLSDVEQALP